jgi:hypothetical protein
MAVPKLSLRCGSRTRTTTPTETRAREKENRSLNNLIAHIGEAVISQASVLSGKTISACCSAAAIAQDYGHCAPLLIRAWTNSPADS